MFNRRLLFNGAGGVILHPATLEFDINDEGGSSIAGAVITITYNGESTTKTADNKGLAVFYDVPQNTNISYTVTASGYNSHSSNLIIEDLGYYTETVYMQKIINHDFGLNIGYLYNVEMGAYTLGYFTSGTAMGSINPNTYQDCPIVAFGLNVFIVTNTSQIMINTLEIDLTGDTRSKFQALSTVIGGSTYNLSKISYTSGKTQYYVELGQNQTLFNYLDTRRGQTIDVTINNS